MFENIGWPEIMVIIVAGLFILGPERLPEAIAWVGRTMRKIRDYATGARDKLKEEMGSDFDELRKPLEDLRSLRSMGPRRAITQHLLDGYDPTDDFRQYDPRGDFEEAKLPAGGPFRNGSMGSSLSTGSTNGGSTNGAPAEPATNGSNGSANGSAAGKQNGYPRAGSPTEPVSPATEPAPFDPDAT